MSAAFEIVALSPGHNGLDFSCGVAVLDRYLQQQAGQDGRRRIANCFVAVPPDSNSVVGYYTLSATSLPLADVPSSLARRLPRYPSLPAALIGRLAVDRRFAGQKLGAALLFDGIERAVNAEAAIFALVVDAQDERAAGFYRHFRFLPLVSRSMSFFLPLGSAARLDK